MAEAVDWVLAAAASYPVCKDFLTTSQSVGIL